MAKFLGRSIVGFRQAAVGGDAFYAANPTNGERLQPEFYSATDEEVKSTTHLAAEAFSVYGRSSGRERAIFLRTIATKIESIAEELIERAGQETALPKARLQ